MAVQSLKEPQYQIYTCAWEDCHADLHNLETLKKHGYTLEEVFTCYGQARSTGADIPQRADGHAAVTMGKVTIMRDVLQGCARMRSLAQGQRCTIVTTPDILPEGPSIEAIYLHGMHIPEYTQGTWTNHEPRRVRKLLLRREEIHKMLGKLRDDGVTLIPLSVYFHNGYAKVELGVAKGKKSYDKRQDLASRDAQKEINKALGRRAKGMA